MRAEDFKQLLIVRPFNPFRVYMTDGSTYDILHPDNIIVSRSYVTVGVGADATGLTEGVMHLSLLHIVRVEPLPSASAKKDGNSAN